MSFWVAQIVEPQVNVLGHDGRALQRGGGKSHHHKTDFMAEQRLQQAEFSF